MQTDTSNSQHTQCHRIRSAAQRVTSHRHRHRSKGLCSSSRRWMGAGAAGCDVRLPGPRRAAGRSPLVTSIAWQSHQAASLENCCKACALAVADLRTSGAVSPHVSHMIPLRRNRRRHPHPRTQQPCRQQLGQRRRRRARLQTGWFRVGGQSSWPAVAVGKAGRSAAETHWHVLLAWPVHSQPGSHAIFYCGS